MTDRPDGGPYEEQEPEEQPVVRDRRRIDPDTGELRDRGDETVPGSVPPTESGTAESGTAESAEAGAAAAAAAAAAASETSTTPADSDVAQALAERTADLQRLQAEFVNYKRRVDRDKQIAKESGIASVLTELLPMLDDIGRAREHGELEGGFKAVAEALEATVGKLGLERYGEVGDQFDPRIHEALMHAYSDDVTVTTCSTILQPGYRYDERVLRAARVAVSEPTAPLPSPEEQPPVESTADETDTADGPPGRT